MNDDALHGLHVGEMCGLMFRDNLNLNTERLTGKIVRLEGGSIGRTFHNQKHIHLKKACQFFCVNVLFGYDIG
jgi:hypothetical protein